MGLPTAIKKRWFDPTINLGHMLTIFSAMAVGIAGWYDVQKRVAVLEDARSMQRQIYQARVMSVDGQLKDLSDDARSLRLRVDQISDFRKK